jgi:hypothetical protein
MTSLLTAKQALVRVRQHKQRQKGERQMTVAAHATADADPVVVRIVRLPPATAVSNDRIAPAAGTAPLDPL